MTPVSVKHSPNPLTRKPRRYRVLVRKSHRRPFKLTPENVADIRSRAFSAHDYAVLYDVTEQTIFNIWAGRTWK